MELNEFLLMRHSYDDHSYIDGKNDTSLTRDGVTIARNAAESVLQYLDNRNVVVRYSSKKRAKETAEIVCEKLEENDLKYKAVEDVYLNELFQGDFNFGQMSHNERVNFLQSCWDDFESFRIEGNLNHRFGELKNRNVIVNLGENHNEWSVRIGKAVLNILNDVKENNQVIGITHRGATFEIENIVRMANDEIDLNEVEKYTTVWMRYCQEKVLNVKDVDGAINKVQDFVEDRSL